MLSALPNINFNCAIAWKDKEEAGECLALVSLIGSPWGWVYRINVEEALFFSLSLWIRCTF